MDFSISKPSRETSSRETGSRVTNDPINMYEPVDTTEYLIKLRKEFTSEPSEEIKMLMTDTELHKKIKQKLKLDRTSVEINREEFDMTTKVVRVQDLGRAGAKFNVQRNEEEINKIKAKLNKKK